MVVAIYRGKPTNLEGM